MKRLIYLIPLAAALAACSPEQLPRSPEEAKTELQALQTKAEEHLKNAQDSAESVKQTLTVFGENVTKAVDTTKSTLENVGEVVLSVTGHDTSCENTECKDKP